MNHIKNEIEIMRKIKHKNIIELYDVIYDDNKYVYLILEYCSMGSLSSFLNGKPLKEKYVKNLMSQLRSATYYLHENNIFHRDIKPHNILLKNNHTLKLTDFGFARFFNNDEDKLANTICGSPIYMAPEIIKCNHYNSKTDLWSIGIILYEMIICKPPYRARNHFELINKIESQPVFLPVNISISDNCRNLIHKLLQKNPDNRISWNDFFNHIWFKNNNNDFDLSKLIINENYENNNINVLRVPKSSPIPIKKKSSIYNFSHSNSDSDSLLNIDDNDTNTYVSPMFNTPISFTPNEINGFIFIEPSSNNTSINNNDINNNINTERNITESFINYMNDTLNYFKSFYFGNK
jgi:serine/threonine protein kinase